MPSPQDSYFPAVLVRRLYDVTRRVQSSEDLPAVLEEIARGVTEGLGFGVAAISRLEGDQLVIVAVAGPDELRDHFIGRRIPAQRVLQREFSIADHWGILRFVPHHRQDEATLESLWVPDIEIGQEADDWHPLDTLYGPLYSPTGELIFTIGRRARLGAGEFGEDLRQRGDLLIAQLAEEALFDRGEVAGLGAPDQLEPGVGEVTLDGPGV